MTYVLKYMYTLDYDVPKNTRQPNQTTGIRIEHWEHSHIQRDQRDRLRYGLTHVNASTMAEAVTLVQASRIIFVHDSHFDELVIDGSCLTWDNVQELLDLFERSGSTDGAAFYTHHHDDGEMVHAKIYKMADYLGIHELCDLAFNRVFEASEVTFGSQVRREAVGFLMPIIVKEKERRHWQIANALWRDLNRFGFRSHARKIVEDYPVLRECILQATFHDKESRGFHWFALDDQSSEI